MKPIPAKQSAVAPTRRCDICGSRWPIARLTRGSDRNWRCPNDVEMPAVERDRIEAAFLAGVREPPPIPEWADTAHQSGYYEEGTLLSLLCDERVQSLDGKSYVTGAAGYTAVSREASQPRALSDARTIAATGWCGIYLYTVASQADRPASFVARAKSKLTELADYLGTLQHATNAGNLMSGGFDEPGIADSTYQTLEGNATGGLTLLYAYRLTGNAAYLDRARRVAYGIRLWQRGGDFVDYFAIPYAGGGTDRWNSGTFVNTMSDVGGVRIPSHAYYPKHLVALWFCKELMTTDGDSSYGDASAAGDMNAATSATLSTMISQCRAFWASAPGQAQSTAGFSAATPYEYYDSYFSVSGAPQTGRGWTYFDVGSDVSGANYAKALWALYQYEGYSSQVSSVYEYLRAYTSNATYETSATATDTDIKTGRTGTYDPNFALATQLNTSTRKNSTAIYDLGTAGLLAAIQASRAQGDLKTVKEALASNVLRVPADDAYNYGAPGYLLDDLKTWAQCGLSMQTYSDRANAYVEKIAQTGLIYRSAPVVTGMEPQV